MTTDCPGRSNRPLTCWRLVYIGFLILALLQGSSLFAQTATGSITGNVSDSSSAALVETDVKLVNTNTNEFRLAKTNTLGYYSYTLLPPGQYQLTVERPGFKKFVQENIRLDVGVGLTVNATLEIGSATDAITVNATPEILESQSSTLGEVIDNRTIDNLPLNGRNSYSFAALVPGVIAPGGFTQTAIDEYNDQFVSINGSRPNANLFLLDGGTNTEPSFSGPGVYPSVDLVDQYNVQTNNLSAEFTGTGGGVVNVVTKSGTNRFHGSAYEYYRNTTLSANNFFSNRAGLPRAPFGFNQFGGSLGGPILKNKTFFFFSYEGVRWAEGVTVVSTVPTDAQKSGDFSRTLDASGHVIPIFDPFTTRQDPTHPGQFRRDQFPGNIVPTNEINPVAKALLNYFPEPTGTGDPSTGTNNFTSNTTSNLTKNDYSIRVDHAFNPNQKLFGRFTTSTTHQPRPNVYGSSSDLEVGNPTNGNDILKQLQATIGHTMILRPNLVLELNSSGVYYSLNRVASGQGVDPTKIGFPSNYEELAKSYSPCFLATTIAGMVPNSSLGNILSGATIGSFCGFHYRFNNFHEYGNLTLVKGAHIFKMGADFGRAMMWGQGFSNVYPILNFGPNFTQGPDPQNPEASSGMGFASFLVGTGSGNTPSGGPPLLLFHNFYSGGYFQDDWKVTRKLTLNLGLRYDYNAPLVQDTLGVANWNYIAPSPIQVPGLNLVGGLQFPGKTSLWDSNHGNVSPRFGFGLAATNNTVIRGGFGLITAPIDGAGFNQNAMPSPGFQGSTPWVGTLDGVTPLNTLSNPFPNGFVLPTGSSLGLATALGQSVSSMDRHRPSSYTEQWNFDVQQLMPGNILLDVAYAGSHGIHLFADTLINQLPNQDLSLGNQLTSQVSNPFYPRITSGPLSSPTLAMSQLLLPYPQFATVDLANGSTYGASSYNAMYLKVERRFANGFSILGSYTWSKLMDNIPASETGFPGGVYQDETFNGGGGGTQDWHNLRAEWSLATYDTPQYLAINGVWELPFGNKKRYFNQAHTLNYLIGGWQLNGIATVHSGSPLEVYMANNTLFNNGGTQRANWNGRNPTTSGRTTDKLSNYFDVSDFSAPASFTYGNSSRTLGFLRSPGLANIDLSGVKNVLIKDRVNAQFRAEAFNLFNHPQFGPPDTSLGDGNTGVISSQINLPREIQLAFRVEF